MLLIPTVKPKALETKILARLFEFIRRMLNPSYFFNPLIYSLFVLSILRQLPFTSQPNQFKYSKRQILNMILLYKNIIGVCR